MTGPHTGARHAARRTVILIVVVLAAAAASLAVLRPFGVRSRALARAADPPAMASIHAGVWYWVERPDGPGATLARAGQSGREVVATADAIGSYDVDGPSAAWCARSGQGWSIQASPAAGAQSHELWSGATKPGGLRLLGERLYWAVTVPPTQPDAGPYPPLGPMLRVLSVPLAGGAPTVLSTIMDPGEASVLGRSGDSLYICAVRATVPEQTVVYRLPVGGGAARRVVGERGRQSALATRSGDLYWLAPSRESSRSDLVCIRRLGKDDRIETLSDWVPSYGMLYETRRGVCCIDGSPSPAVWPVGENRALPRPLTMPDGCLPLAVGEGEALLTPTMGKGYRLLLRTVGI
jgi:hypothetical protein